MTASGPPLGRAKDILAPRAVQELRIAKARPSMENMEKFRFSSCVTPSPASIAASSWIDVLLRGVLEDRRRCWGCSIVAHGMPAAAPVSSCYVRQTDMYKVPRLKKMNLHSKCYSYWDNPRQAVMESEHAPGFSRLTESSALRQCWEKMTLYAPSELPRTSGHG